MNEDERLLRLTEKATAYRAARRPAALGKALARYMDGRVAPRQEVFAMVKKAWEEVVPAGLGDVCRLGGVEGGKVRVLVSSPAYLYQLRLCAGQLLSELQKRCEKKTVRYIKFELG